MKKLIKILVFVLSVFSLVSCGNDNKTNDNKVDKPTTETPGSGTSGDTTTPGGGESKDETTQTKDTKIYLAGDSTVKTYEDNQYIGGWGQYLDSFLDDDIEVINCAQGGRSSRSFINEGRLFDIEGNNYTFSQNGGKSIGSVIEEGDYLFIQFGHNDDDTKKASSYSTLYDRMVPLGTKDANGNYPTTAGTKKLTTYLPQEYLNNVSSSSSSSAYTEIAKYGDSYYSYDCGGTYKWFLKQYIDFARDNGAIPVLVTPVARVKFSGNEIVGGPGLHGENFAYVEAVKQLAREEDCLLIDLFSDTKDILETATSTYSNYLMALKPNDLVGEWPAGYDKTYNNTTLGYTGIEATHYNKYGAYLTAAHLIEDILNNESKCNDGKEEFNFKEKIKTNPKKYVDPSNLMSKTVVSSLEGKLSKVEVTNPNRTYKSASETVKLINDVLALNLTASNITEYETAVNAAFNSYYSLNVDDRSGVTNYESLLTANNNLLTLKEELRPKPTSTIVINANDLTNGDYTSKTELENVTIYASADKKVSISNNSNTATYAGIEYTFTKGISLGGSASFGSNRYLEIVTTSSCVVTVIAKSSGTDNRVLNMVNSSNTATSVGSFNANSTITVTSQNVEEAGTYMIGSSNKGIWVYAIIIEYFN